MDVVENEKEEEVSVNVEDSAILTATRNVDVSRAFDSAHFIEKFDDTTSSCSTGLISEEGSNLSQNKSDLLFSFENSNPLNNTVNMNERSLTQTDESVRKPFIDKLKELIVADAMKITTVNKLLRLLKEEYDPSLPTTHATLFRTNNMKKFEIKSFGSKSKFVYFGIARQLKRILNADLHDPAVPLYLQVNKDGLPLFKSSRNEFWPILGRIHFKPSIYKPFSIALYFGEGKPEDVNLYLQEFIEELNEILKNGVEIEEKLFKMKLMCFINDIPL